jgi:ferritin-like metal-binding protein YciE
MKTLNDLFLEELADIYNAEKRIAQALPKLADAARSEELKAAFESHLQETEGHVGKVEEVFRLFETEPREAECEATAGLLEEGDELAGGFPRVRRSPDLRGPKSRALRNGILWLSAYMGDPAGEH